MGGKSPNIVFDDADLKAAVRGSVWGIFNNAGQVCVAGTRLLVQASIADQFIDRLRASARAHPGGRSDRRRHTDGAAVLPATIRSGERIPRHRPRRGRPSADRRIQARRHRPERSVLAADDPHRPELRDARRPRGDLRPGSVRAHLRQRGRRRRARQRHRLRAQRQHLDTRQRPHAAHGTPRRGRHDLGEHDATPPPGIGIRRVQGERTRRGVRRRGDRRDQPDSDESRSDSTTRHVRQAGTISMSDRLVVPPAVADHRRRQPPPTRLVDRPRRSRRPRTSCPCIQPLADSEPINSSKHKTTPRRSRFATWNWPASTSSPMARCAARATPTTSSARSKASTWTDPPRSSTAQDARRSCRESSAPVRRTRDVEVDALSYLLATTTRPVKVDVARARSR